VKEELSEEVEGYKKDVVVETSSRSTILAAIAMLIPSMTIYPRSGYYCASAMKKGKLMKITGKEVSSSIIVENQSSLLLQQEASTLFFVLFNLRALDKNEKHPSENGKLTYLGQVSVEVCFALFPMF